MVYSVLEGFAQFSCTLMSAPTSDKIALCVTETSLAECFLFFLGLGISGVHIPYWAHPSPGLSKVGITKGGTFLLL